MSKRMGLSLAAVGVAILLGAGTMKPIHAGGDDGGVLIGKKAGKVDGRWLELDDGKKVAGYKSVFVGDISVNIEWKDADKNTPVDEELLKGRIKDEILMNLQEGPVFAEILKGQPPQGQESVVRLDCDLLVEPGNRGMRYLVGFGAGKSKSILKIVLKDHSTGEELGLYHGYGTGTGMGFKLAGGGARKMSQDDIQENAKQFGDLLRSVIVAAGS